MGVVDSMKGKLMLEILDTTLREGEQTPDVSFTIEEKIERLLKCACKIHEITQPRVMSATNH